MSSLESNENIEDQVQNIISTKLKNGKLNPNDTKTVEKLLELFPELQDKFSDYMDKSQVADELKKSDDLTLIVLNEINIDGTIYYKDNRGGIWNKQAELVGTVSPNENSKYIFFKTDYQIKINLGNIFL